MNEPMTPAEIAEVERRERSTPLSSQPSVAPGEQNLISSQGEGEVGGSVPQNLPELIGGPVRPRVAEKLSHSQDKTHSRNAGETLKPTPTSPVSPGEAQREPECKTCADKGFVRYTQDGVNTGEVGPCPACNPDGGDIDG